MEKNDIIKRLEKLEENSHPPVSWKSKIDILINKIDHLLGLYGEMINRITKQRK
tara:strand:- start:791 stop:952 length:162 start_codon:yes stop_codon:yes gene_type:complete